MSFISVIHPTAASLLSISQQTNINY